MSYVNALLPTILTLLVVVASGLWLSRLGKPYSGLWFNFHKLAALAGVVLAVLWIIQRDLLQNSSAVIFILVVISAAAVAALFGTGTVMSIQEAEPTRENMIHRAASILVPVCAGLAVILLLP